MERSACDAALTKTERLCHFCISEREHLHQLLIEDAKRGLADIEAGRTEVADAVLARLQRRRLHKG